MDQHDDATPELVASLPLDERPAAYLEAHRRLTDRLGVPVS